MAARNVEFDSMIYEETSWETGMPTSELGRRLAAGEIKPPGKAADLRCGMGMNVIYLAQWGFDVVGVDSSARALQLAMENANRNKVGRMVRFVLSDALRIRNIGEPFDFVFDQSCYLFAREKDLERYLATLEAFTKPGSMFLCLCGNANEMSDHGKRPLGGLPRVTEEQIRTELGWLFEIVDLREFRFDPSPYAGNLQPLGWSCLMRRI